MQKVLLAALLGLMCINCAGVTSGQPTTASVNGDTWYSKDRYLITKLIPTGSDVYYCPKETPSKCTKADVKE